MRLTESDVGCVVWVGAAPASLMRSGCSVRLKANSRTEPTGGWSVGCVGGGGFTDEPLSRFRSNGSRSTGVALFSVISGSCAAADRSRFPVESPKPESPAVSSGSLAFACEPSSSGRSAAACSWLSRSMSSRFSAVCAGGGRLGFRRFDGFLPVLAGAVAGVVVFVVLAAFAAAVAAVAPADPGGSRLKLRLLTELGGSASSRLSRSSVIVFRFSAFKVQTQIWRVEKNLLAFHSC